VACACASVVGRSIHAVVRPVLRARDTCEGDADRASFQWFLSMAMSPSADETVASKTLFGHMAE